MRLRPARCVLVPNRADIPPCPCPLRETVRHTQLSAHSRDGEGHHRLGHDYGGLIFIRGEKAYFPWEYLCFFSDQGNEGGGWVNIPYGVDLGVAALEIQFLLAEAPQEPPFRNLILSNPRSTSGYDPFDSLPEELCWAIAAHLPTTDLLNARLASRSFWAVIDTQHFWASRFSGADSERCWLFEAARDLSAPGGIGRRDWCWLYHRTANARLEAASKNRRRVWNLIRPVADIMDLSWNELPPKLPAPWRSTFFPQEPISSPLWAAAMGSLWGYNEDITPLQKACSISKTQQMAIPVDCLSRISASTVILGSSVYIAGLTLTATTGEVLTLGYTGPDTQQSVQLNGATLTGFNVAVGLRGIQALQCVSSGVAVVQRSAWLGSPDGVPLTRRLRNLPSGDELVMAFGFDVRLPRSPTVRSAFLTSPR